MSTIFINAGPAKSGKTTRSYAWLKEDPSNRHVFEDGTRVPDEAFRIARFGKDVMVNVLTESGARIDLPVPPRGVNIDITYMDYDPDYREVNVGRHAGKQVSPSIKEDDDERITAWHKIAAHPTFTDCYRDNSGRPLIELMIERLDHLTNIEHEARQRLVDSAPGPDVEPEKDVYDFFSKIVVSGGQGSYKDLHYCLVCGALMGNIDLHRQSHGLPKPERILPGQPHSRACGPLKHEHGPACSANCPTCHGKLRDR